MSNIVKYALLAIASVALILLLAAVWLTQTSSGSRWLWHRTVPLIPGELGAATVEGSIASGLSLTDLSYVSEAVQVDVARASLSARLVLFPLTIDIPDFRADRIDIGLKDTAKPDEPGEPVFDKLALPFPLNLRNVQVTRLKVINPAGEQVFLLHRAAFAGHWHDDISLTRLDLDSTAVALSGSMRLELAEPYHADADVAGTYPVPLGDGEVYPVNFTATAGGSLADLQIDLVGRDPDVQVTGQLFRLHETPGWDLRVQSPHFQWPLRSGGDQPPQVYLREADLETQGDLSGYAISGSGMVAVAGTEELYFSIVTDGTSEGLTVSGLELRGDMLAATSVGELRWSGGVAVAVDADVEHFDPAAVTENWPAGQPVSGTVDAGWETGNLKLNEVRLRVQNSPAMLDAAGEINLDGNIVDLDLDWRDLRWPMSEEVEAATHFISESGKVRVSGSPDDWAFDGRIAFRTDTLPQGVFVLTGQGNREKVEALLHDSEVLGGMASGSGSYNWAEGRWSADLATGNLDISPLAPEFPGRISASFTAEGQLDPVQVDVSISQLDGTIRGQPLQGTGGIRYAGGDLVARQLVLRSGESEVQASGSARSPSGLDFSLDVAALETFHPDVAGTLRAQGNLSLAEGFPSLALDLDAAELYWGDFALQEFTVTSIDAPPATPLALAVEGAGLTAGARELQTIALQVSAGEDRQRLLLDLAAEGKQLHLELDGALGDWRKPLESVWSGELEAFRFEAAEGVEFALENPAALQLSRNALSLERSCITGGDAGTPDQAPARVCLATDWTGSTNLTLAAEMEALPVSLVRLLFDTDLEFTQMLSGGISIGSGGADGLSGEGDILISPGRIWNNADERMATQTGAGEVHFNLVDGQLLAGRLTLPFSDSAEIDANFEAADVSMGADSEVSGRLAINLNNIAVAAGLAPMIDEARGRLDVDLGISGTLGNPLFAGEASLKDGSLRYQPLGLRLTDIQMQSTIREDNRIDLQTTFRAGEGTGELRSSVNSVGGLREGLDLFLTGENLALIDLPDISVVANTDLSLGVTAEGLTINGNIIIPRARLAPVDLTSGDRISESEDVVIVANGSEPEETGVEETPFEMYGTVALVLGEDVVVDLDVAETRVSGTAAFHWEGPHMPVANGQYNIEGRFEAYGQLLDITEGRVQFPGVPASSPSLRIRAEREIFGNPQIRNAGVLVTGTPQEPQVEVYTNPATTRDRALTLLVTGSDFNYEQGVGAVDVGTYIAPDLYISYGIGLFERGNVISIRYDIAKGFGIKATSGKNAEGVDLSYTLER
jgi:translocation and assembly module TamB